MDIYIYIYIITKILRAQFLIIGHAHRVNYRQNRLGPRLTFNLGPLPQNVLCKLLPFNFFV